MQKTAINELQLHRSDEDIHASLERFALKWHDKAGRVQAGERVSR